MLLASLTLSHTEWWNNCIKTTAGQLVPAALLVAKSLDANMNPSLLKAILSNVTGLLVHMCQPYAYKKVHNNSQYHLVNHVDS